MEKIAADRCAEAGRNCGAAGSEILRSADAAIGADLGIGRRTDQNDRNCQRQSGNPGAAV